MRIGVAWYLMEDIGTLFEVTSFVQILYVYFLKFDNEFIVICIRLTNLVIRKLSISLWLIVCCVNIKRSVVLWSM